MQDHPSEDEINRLMAKAMAFYVSHDDAGRHLPPEISIFAGVPSKSGPPTVDDAAARLYSFLSNVNEPEFRRFMAGVGERLALAFGIAEPRRDKVLEEVAERRRKPNLALALEVLLESMRRGPSTMTVRGPDDLGPSTLRRTGDGKEITITSKASGAIRKRKAWSVFSSLIDGDFTLFDPEGRALVRSEGVGSLHGPELVAWRSGPGPAAKMPAGELVDFIMSAALLAGGSGLPLPPAVLVVSENGWFSASHLSDVPGGSDAEKFERCLMTASVLDPRLICLIDFVGSGHRSSPLVAYAHRGRSEVLDPGASKRAEPPIWISHVHGFAGRQEVGASEGVAISLARATAFAEQARKLVD